MTILCSRSLAALAAGLYLLVSAAPASAAPGSVTSHQLTRTDFLAVHETHSAANRFGQPGKASAVTRTVEIEARDIAFSPGALSVKRGETIRFVIHNYGQLDHEFMIGDSTEQIEHDKEMAAMPGMAMNDPNGVSVAPGKTASLIWKFSKPGTFEYGCHVPGHYASGMLGKLSVQ
jgi:uncharacterized cupredoxin-like copper-binding protein